MQVPGVNYTKKFAPVASNTLICLVLLVTLIHEDKGWVCESVDIKAAFLEGANNKPMFMEWPPGSVQLGFASEKQIEETCLMMLKCIYSNVNAALVFYTTYSNHLMKVLGMKRCHTDP